MLESQLLATIMVVLSAPIAYKVRFLDGSGTLAASLLGLCVGYTLGPVFLGVLIIFLAVNGLLTRMGYFRKALLGAAEPKGGARTWRSVVANGLSATVFAVLSTFLLRELFLVGFMGAVATASADTASTEVGLLSRSKPKLITNFSRVEPGLSGGVTPLGFLGGLVGAASIGVVGIYVVHALYGFQPLRVFGLGDPFTGGSLARYASATTLGGFCGSIFDSLLGATLQAKYVCTVCSKTTEKARHCGVRAKLVKGLRLLDNDAVNVVATALGALTSVTLFVSL